ncbi:hypothetical protein [Paenibacillus sp. S28]|uniref:hypothetical protein n=1 Tax=Paenibacillus sp. S28 TaxID=2767463 RepID=UPI00190C3BD0|nr:hypothetical protein [Paenibacillus sp. S28]MBJ9989429.1 hypothetical protein [Paenibacillus sp. S28]
MPKKLRNYPIYIAPNISGYLDRGYPKIYDEISQRELDPYLVDHKIEIYSRQVNEWFLGRASRLLQGKNNGFIVLMICISYIEGVQQYINGRDSRNQSRQVFIQGLNRIFSLNLSDNDLNEFYKEVRCGLFHNGMSGTKVIISSHFDSPIQFIDSNTIKINQELFLKIIRQDFKNYMLDLKDENNYEMREKFDRMFNVV